MNTTEYVLMGLAIVFILSTIGLITYIIINRKKQNQSAEIDPINSAPKPRKRKIKKI